MNKEYTVTDSDAGSRLDVFLSAQPDNPSRSNIQKMITEGNVSVNGQVKRANYKLRPADNIVMTYQPPQEIEAVPEDIPLDILYEDSDIIVVNKARGMVVHPAAGVYTGTLVNALLYHCGDELSGINGKIRPGIVHRLDKDTSGVMVVAKNDFAHNSLAEQIGSKTAVKEYVALVHGNITEEKGIIEANIGRHPVDRKKMAVVTSGGKPATTVFHVLERFKNCTFVKCRLLTGRTHQIRVHMAYIGHPLIGDPKYCNSKNKFDIQGQALHSLSLTLIHPRTNQEMTFTAPIPQDMQKLLKYFRQTI
ncbi:RluA family pseudouridine synthase [Megamonas hypermegale]|uniref:RluA family pseudouridine synthase n=1 Tax=Megamonas hypermegale TaxID=158847 RepID=UPI0025A480E1|nr:RluA family pseudouridine synthase [Megamonas hypermegale]MDM8142200.1 RluA family pseudouridine synthase [Megamonas hypermegale]